MINNDTDYSNNNIFELELIDTLVLKLLDKEVKLSLISINLPLKKSIVIKKSKKDKDINKDKGRQPYTSIADDLCWCSHEKTQHINKESCSQCECKGFDH